MTVAMLMRNALSGYYLSVADNLRAKIKAAPETFKAKVEEAKAEDLSEGHAWKKLHGALVSSVAIVSLSLFRCHYFPVISR